MKIIAFGHRQRTGKDTAGRLLFNHLRYEYPRLKLYKTCFFGPVKDVCGRLFSWSGLQDAEFYENYPGKKDTILPLIGKSPRQIWLEFGHYLREIDPRSVARFALSLIPIDTEVVIITDLRDPSEIEDIRTHKGSLVVRIDRNVPKLESKLTGHPAYNLDSKLENYDQWDRVLDNNGSMRDLSKQLEGLYVP